MNRFTFMGRLTADPDIRFKTGENALCIANFNLAVDKRFKKKDDPNAQTADFFRITALGKLGEFAQKYLAKGTKILVEGRVENNNYTNKDGQKVYGLQFIAENIEFAESRKASESNGSATKSQTNNDDTTWLDPGDVNTDDLPFK